MSDAMIWTVILVLGAGTFLLRFSFIYLSGRVALPVPVTRALRFVPASVLSALVVPGLTFNHAGVLDISASNFYLVAGIFAALVAWLTRNMLASLAAGMGALWLLQWLMG
jgi:branched-subunit amino acid transport protein